MCDQLRTELIPVSKLLLLALNDITLLKLALSYIMVTL